MISQETNKTIMLLLDALENEVAESSSVPEAKNKISEYKLIFGSMAKN